MKLNMKKVIAAIGLLIAIIIIIVAVIIAIINSKKSVNASTTIEESKKTQIEQSANEQNTTNQVQQNNWSIQTQNQTNENKVTNEGKNQTQSGNSISQNQVTGEGKNQTQNGNSTNQNQTQSGNSISQNQVTNEGKNQTQSGNSTSQNQVTSEGKNQTQSGNSISQNQVTSEGKNQTQSGNTTNQSTPQENNNKEEKKKSIIYLTFDDGPTATSTPKILDILKEEKVKATFFILNYSDNNSELIKREISEGHSVGIHGYSHDYKEIYKSEETYMENLNKLQQKIEKTTGVKTYLTRFPGGSSNTISKFNPGIMTRLTKKVQEEGYKYYDWNIDSNDAGSAKTKEAVYSNVTSALRKNRSNVVLMHDFSNNKKTIGALKDIIEFGKKNGYEFRAITYEENLQMHHGVLN